MFRSIIFKTGHTGLIFISSLVLSRLLIPEHFGIISLLLLNSTLLNILTGFGAESMIMHMVSNKKVQTPEAAGYLFRVLAIQIGFFLLIETAGYFIFQKTILSWMPLGEFLFPEILYFLGLILLDKILIFFYAHLKPLKINRLLFGLSIIYILALFLFFFKAQTTILEVFTFFSVFSFLQGLILLFYFLVSFNVQISWLSGYNKKLYLNQSFMILSANIIQLFAYRIDLWIIKLYYGNEEVGLFSLSGKFANLIWMIPNLLSQLLLPFFNKISIGDASKVFRSLIGLNLLITIITIVSTFIIYTFFISDAYKDSLTAFYWMLPGYFCWAAVIYFAGYFSWKGEFIYNLYASSACFVLIFILDLLLIPQFSYVGAAIANSIAYSLILVYYISLFTKKNSLKLFEFLSFRRSDFTMAKSLLKH